MTDTNNRLIDGMHWTQVVNRLMRIAQELETESTKLADEARAVRRAIKDMEQPRITETREP